MFVASTIWLLGVGQAQASVQIRVVQAYEYQDNYTVGVPHHDINAAYCAPD